MLTVLVLDPPTSFCGGAIELKLQTKAGYTSGTPDGHGLRFETEYVLKADKSGVSQPFGEAVQRGDGRRFIYFSWLGPEGMFRRIKLYFDQVPGFPHAESPLVRIAGRNAKGEPACSTALVQ